MNVAVSNVNKRDIQEVKAFANPPKGVKEVFEAVHILKTGQVPEWVDLKKEMNNPEAYVSKLFALNANKDQIPKKNIQKLGTYTAR